MLHIHSLSLMLQHDDHFRRTYLQGPPQCGAWLVMCIARALTVYSAPLDTEAFMVKNYSTEAIASLQRRVDVAMAIASGIEPADHLLVPCAAEPICGPLIGALITPSALYSSVLMKGPQTVFSEENLAEWIALC